MLKNILDYILIEERLDTFFFHCIWILPILSIMLGAITANFRKNKRRSLILSIVTGFLASFLSSLWFVYKGITDYYGIDSVKGLIINLALFLVLGILLGFFIRWFRNLKFMQIPR